jgi:hypothetical protein
MLTNPTYIQKWNAGEWKQAIDVELKIPESIGPPDDVRHWVQYQLKIVVCLGLNQDQKQAESIADRLLLLIHRYFPVEYGFSMWWPTFLDAIHTGSVLTPAGAEYYGVKRTENTIGDPRVTNWDRGITILNMQDAGALPGVFRWNLLTGALLTREVDGLPLPEWVEADASRGTIDKIADTPLGEPLLRWTVEPEQEAALNDDLKEKGVIVDRDEWQRVRYRNGLRHRPPWPEWPDERWGRLVDAITEPVVQSDWYDPEFVLVRRPLSDIVDEKTHDELTDDQRVCDLVVVDRAGKVHLILIAFPSILPVTAERKLRSMLLSLPEQRRGTWRVIGYEEAKAMAGWPAGEPIPSGWRHPPSGVPK